MDEGSERRKKVQTRRRSQPDSRRRKSRPSTSLGYTDRKPKRRHDYPIAPTSYDLDSDDNYTRPFRVRRFLGGHSEEAFDSMGDGFIYWANMQGSPFDGCSKVALSVVDKAISPIELEMEFGKEEKKTLPSYYYNPSAGKPGNSAKKDKKEQFVNQLEEIKENGIVKAEPKTPTFIGNSPWCFASPDKNFQIFVLPPKPNILRFEEGSGYSGSYSRTQALYSREHTGIAREMSSLSITSAKTELVTPSLPGVLPDVSRPSPQPPARPASTKSNQVRSAVSTPTSRLPGRAY